jgi:selenocysteine lyase/cysteine desulfurase
MTASEKYFEQFREGIIGIDAEFESPYGKKKIIYADWIASGRLYAPIEKIIIEKIAPLVGNTHSEASETGQTMTNIYHQAQKFIKNHVNANENDILISSGSGMTSAINKLQRILGIKVPERARKYCKNDIPEEDIPVVFITHMEHHSNQTSWLETMAEVVILKPDEDLLVCKQNLEKKVKKYKTRKLKIGSFSAGSNVTGVIPNYYELAEIMHNNGGFAFVDFAASAPYINIDMHPENPNQALDAIFFSPHKALGGPGSSGVVIFNKILYKNHAPDNPGGGTVAWTNRWNEYSFVCNIEAKEDGGTPPFLQTMRTALALSLKEKMGCDKITEREHELIKIAFSEFEKIPLVNVLAEKQKHRLGVFSFFVSGIHHNLLVKLLNDLYGIQVRGGCSCAGTYGHYLLGVNKSESHRIASKIDIGDLSEKPGWVRMSIHPTMRNDELLFFFSSLKDIIDNIENYSKDYEFDIQAGEYFHKKFARKKPEDFKYIFEI